MTYKVKGIKNVYRWIGTEEYEIQNFDFGLVTPKFCLLWKKGEKINKKIIKELLNMKEEVEKEDKEINNQKSKEKN